MRSGLAVAVAAVLLALGPASATGTAAASGGRALPDRVTTEAVKAHLRHLDTITERHGGTRASGTRGYDAAAAYVATRLRWAGYRPVREEYTFDEWVEHSDAVLARTEPDPHTFGVGTDFTSMVFSASGDVTAPAVAVEPGGADSGCQTEDFTGFPAGAIAVLHRGACTFADKTANAAEAGAVGAVVVNHGATPQDTGPVNGTVSEPSRIPVVGASVATGEALLAAEKAVRVRLRVDAEVVTSSSYNIIAETRGAAHDDVVVVGAHLDSVAEGPGSNDNGSGVAAVLEIARQLPRLGRLDATVRFAFWGSEEVGLVGSTQHVAGLSDAELARIALYLNVDMIGSPNYSRLVYDGRGELPGSVPAPAGSELIQRTFEDYFAARGLAVEPTEFNGRSDYRAFLLAGIPSGGLFSGADAIKTERQAARYGGRAGQPHDPNYHTPDDTIANVNWDSVTELSGGIAHAVQTYATAPPPEPRVAPLAAPVSASPALDRVADRWTR